MLVFEFKAYGNQQQFNILNYQRKKEEGRGKRAE
jgi:hypothetical protein